MGSLGQLPHIPCLHKVDKGVNEFSTVRSASSHITKSGLSIGRICCVLHLKLSALISCKVPSRTYNEGPASNRNPCFKRPIECVSPSTQ
jgi:hypothetical protein